MNTAWIDENSGLQMADNGGSGAIVEAFKPGTGPNPPTSMIGLGGGRGYDTQNPDNQGATDPNAPPLQDPPLRTLQDIFRGRGGLF
jgi:penicillin-binding protein 1A